MSRGVKLVGKQVSVAFFYRSRFNIRDLFEFHLREMNPGKAEELVSRGRTDLKTLQMLSQWDAETWTFGVGRTPSLAKPEVQPEEIKKTESTLSIFMNIINKLKLAS